MGPSPAISASTPLPSLLSSAPGLRGRRRSGVPIPPRPLSPVSSLPLPSPSYPLAPLPSSHNGALSRRGALCLLLAAASAAEALFSPATPSAQAAEFFEIEGSGGVKALDLRAGDGEVPADGDQVAIHYYGRLAAKRGWRFDSTYDHKDEAGDSVPFVFVVGSGKGIREDAISAKRERSLTKTPSANASQVGLCILGMQAGCKGVSSP